MLRVVIAEIEPLLILQDRDQRRLDIEHQLERTPLEVERAESRIAAETAKIEAERQRLRDLEVRRKEIDNDLKAAEAKVLQYRNQQLSVKKNEELEALNHEIETLQGQISDLEDAELEALEEIDTAQAALTAFEAEAEATIKHHRREIELLTERAKQLEGDLGGAIEAVETAKARVDERYLAAYGRARQRAKRPPWVVPMRDQKCGGCHLKVAGDTDTAVRAGKQPAQCESCGRLLYIE